MQLSDEEIVEMILFPVVNEACCILEDKIVVKASDLDVASVTGMGFPEYMFVPLLLFFFLSNSQMYNS